MALLFLISSMWLLVILVHSTEHLTSGGYIKNENFPVPYQIMLSWSCSWWSGWVWCCGSLSHPLQKFAIFSKNSLFLSCYCCIKKIRYFHKGQVFSKKLLCKFSTNNIFSLAYNSQNVIGWIVRLQSNHKKAHNSVNINTTGKSL